MIDEPIFSEFPGEFSDALLEFCEAPGPAPAFVSGLERRLLGHQALLLGSTHRSPRRWWRQVRGSVTRHAWRYVIVGVLIVLCAALIAIGPQRVLAQVQQWLGYLSGVGFINPDQTRVLAAPVEARQGNTILQVTQVIASADQTVLVVTLSGSAEEIPMGIEWATKVSLILPDGQHLTPQNSTQQGRVGQLSAEIVYVHLPARVNLVTLEVPRLPMITDGSQAFWSVSLPLVAVRQAATDASGSASPANLAVTPYTPTNVQVSNQGVTVRLLQVAQSAQETGILLEIDWSDPTWEYLGAGVELHDNLGHTYPQLAAAPGTGDSALGFSSHQKPVQQMVRFAPIAPDARQLTLTLDSITFTIHPRVEFTFDPSSHPALGQTWSFVGDPAMRLTIAGFQVQVIEANLAPAPADSQMHVKNPPEATLLPQPTDLPRFACRVNFIIEVTPRENARLFVGGPSLVDGYHVSGGAHSEDNDIHATFYMDLLNIPTTPLAIELNDATLYLEGGWQFNWDLPGTSASPGSP